MFKKKKKKKKTGEKQQGGRKPRKIVRKNMAKEEFQVLENIMYYINKVKGENSKYSTFFDQFIIYGFESINGFIHFALVK